MSLLTRRIINRNGWTELPMPDSVINVVHRLSRRNKDGFFNTYNGDIFIFDDNPNDPHDDDEGSDDENESEYVDTD